MIRSGAESSSSTSRSSASAAKSESDLRSVGTDVSREHAEIVRMEGTAASSMKDRGSRCGTFVNDEQVSNVPRHKDKIGSAEISAEMVFLFDDPRLTVRRCVRCHRFPSSDGAPGSSAGLGSARVLEEVLVLVMDSAIDATGAERGFIMLANERRTRIQDRAHATIDAVGKVVSDELKIPRDVRKPAANGSSRISVTAIWPGSTSGRLPWASVTSSARHCGSSDTWND